MSKLSKMTKIEVPVILILYRTMNNQRSAGAEIAIQSFQ
ncbi:hypothetical protein D1BOALGB6SA_7421 [Olavius sp. associated proteobacterium Delta 1]|nr:hypothetical protein D1BOALGB6SA_7421 [Olavius sp. associated proteobacterium Delta 1]